MNRLSIAKPLLAGAVGLAALAAVPAAQARSDVHFSIGFSAPIGYVQPAPVYVQPEPVYVYPRHGYYGHRHHGRRGGPWGDADRDGVPNRYDSRPHNPYRY